MLDPAFWGEVHWNTISWVLNQTTKNIICLETFLHLGWGHKPHCAQANREPEATRKTGSSGCTSQPVWGREVSLCSQKEAPVEKVVDPRSWSLAGRTPFSTETSPGGLEVQIHLQTRPVKLGLSLKWKLGCQGPTLSAGREWPFVAQSILVILAERNKRTRS